MEKVGAFSRALIFVFSAWAATEVIPGAERPGTPEGLSPTNPVVLPFEFRRGHIMVPARVHGTNALSLLLDTGYGMTMLSPQFIETFGLKRTGQVTIVGIAGEEPAGVFEGPRFDFAGATWKPRRVAAFPSDDRPRSRRRDGILGSGFFRQFVVEIDSKNQRIVLHEPESYQYSGAGEVLPLTFKSSTPMVDASVRLPDGAEVKAAFEIDTGCDGALCIGKHFVEAHRLVDTNSTSRGGRTGVGGATRVSSGHLPALQLGRIALERPAADFFLEGSPVEPPLAGHIGWDLLREFKVILDYKRARLILERPKEK